MFLIKFIIIYLMMMSRNKIVFSLIYASILTSFTSYGGMTGDAIESTNALISITNQRILY